MKDFRHMIARTIEQGIEKAGSASGLARRIGVTRQQVSRWRSHNKIKLENFLAIVEFISKPEKKEAADGKE